MAKAAKRTLKDDIECIVGDIRNLPFRDRAFDFVYSLEVIERLPRKPESVRIALKEIIRVCKDRGHSLVESTSTRHFHFQSLIMRGLPGIRASIFQEKPLQQFSQIYLKAPLQVADPSPLRLVIGTLVSSGAKIRAVIWIRIIPEQAYVVLKSPILRRLLSLVDDFLVNVPVLKSMGREFIVLTQRLT